MILGRNLAGVSRYFTAVFHLVPFLLSPYSTVAIAEITLHGTLDPLRGDNSFGSGLLFLGLHSFGAGGDGRRQLVRNVL